MQRNGMFVYRWTIVAFSARARWHINVLALHVLYISSFLQYGYSLNKKEWICSLFKEWILEKSEIRVNFEWIFVLFTHFGVTTGITQGFRVIPEVTPKWVNNTNVHSKFTPNSLQFHYFLKFTP